MSANPATAQVTAALATLNAAVAAVATDLQEYAVDLTAAMASNDTAAVTAAIAGINSAAAALTSATAASSAPIPVPALVSIAVTPATPTFSMAANPTEQFAAMGTFASGPAQDLTSIVVWASDTPATATVAAGGLATLVAPGTATISATDGSVTGSTMMTVTA